MCSRRIDLYKLTLCPMVYLKQALTQVTSPANPSANGSSLGKMLDSDVSDVKDLSVSLLAWEFSAVDNT